MPQNFYVAPLGGFQVGPAVTQAIQGGEQVYRQRQIKEKLPEAIKSGDPKQIANFMAEYPEAAETARGIAGFKDEAATKDLVDSAKQILINQEDPVRVLKQRVLSLRERGEDDSKAMQALGEALQDPSAAVKRAERAYALLDPKGYLSYQTAEQGGKTTSVPAELQTFQALTANLPEAEKEKARRIKLGLDPRASEDAASRAEKALAVEVAKLQARLGLEPQIAEATAIAKNEAAAVAKHSEEARSNAKGWAVYDGAMSNLAQAMQGTTTGPIAGFIPAITANAQIAEGAQAVMAPILKQMFRSAGEGTFTDKDQELLMGMVPTRKDLPAARAAKIQAIDTIVRAKLGITDKETGAPREVPKPAPDLTGASDEELWKAAGLPGGAK